jgi:hypothetical protein
MYNYSYIAFGENDLGNLNASESGLSLSDIVLESIDANRLTAAISHPLAKGLTMSATGNFSFTGTPTDLSNVTGKLLTNSVFINGVLNETETWAGGANIQQLLDFAYTSSLLLGDDSFEGSATFNGDDQVQGLGGNDRFKGYGDGQYSDYFYGGDGRDTSIYRGKLSEYVVKSEDAIWDGRLGDGTRMKGHSVQDTVQNRDGKDLLNEVERLEFSDTSLALDIAGHAGSTAKLLGATFGKASIANKDLVGIGLHMLDGGMSYTDLMGAVINAVLGSSASNSAVVELLYTNVIGSAPSVNDLAFFTDWLDKGIYTKASFGVLAADTELNIVNVGLVGLASSGLEYTPYVA